MRDSHIVVLQDYGRHDRGWALDLRSGRITPAAGRRHGFVRPAPQAAEGARTAALFAARERLWLQYGERRWDCATVTVRCDAAAGGTRLFTVTGPHGRELALRYPAPVPEPFDPAYDAIDALEDDFFRWAADRLATAERRRALRAGYLTGFPPSAG
ncbi:hypothetical protein [Streptomyces sp. NPDC048650]|uniref:hypothetical protein n=1 Tax=Streptomyces sp. NPDC048650 TaxID=3365583 RepID=UPI003721DE47